MYGNDVNQANGKLILVHLSLADNFKFGRNPF